jgi:hypothetical protein
MHVASNGRNPKKMLVAMIIVIGELIQLKMAGILL